MHLAKKNPIYKILQRALLQRADIMQIIYNITKDKNIYNLALLDMEQQYNQAYVTYLYNRFVLQQEKASVEYSAYKIRYVLENTEKVINSYSAAEALQLIQKLLQNPSQPYLLFQDYFAKLSDLSDDNIPIENFEQALSNIGKVFYITIIQNKYVIAELIIKAQELLEEKIVYNFPEMHHEGLGATEVTYEDLAKYVFGQTEEKSEDLITYYSDGEINE